MNLTEQQVRAIASRGRVAVSASAGSGKTFVMIERLVSLVLGGEHVREMLAVTFTNKAAAQLRERLRLALLRKIGESTGSERERLAGELNDLPVMDVSTIHAFCAGVIRANFFLTDVAPSFAILSPDMPEGRELSERAMDEVFEEAYEAEGGEFSELLSVYYRKKKDARLRTIVLSLYNSVRGEADYREKLSSIGKGDRYGEICGYLADGYRSRALFLVERIEEMGAWFAEHNPRAIAVSGDLMRALEPIVSAKTLFEMTEHAKAAELSVATMPRMTKASGEELDRLRFLSGASKMTKALYAELREYASEDREESRYLDAERRAAALAALALSYDEKYTRGKRENNVLDYNDLEHLALGILERDEVRKEMRARYRFVCVDEYQDVNPIQERIINAVSDREVFLVGDPKQAIYGFRGSRSEYFDRKTEEADVSLRLTSNFRSSDAVLEGVNRIFAPILKEKYAPMTGGGRYGAHRGAVRLHLLPEKEERGAEPRSVYSVLECEGAEKPHPLAAEVARIAESEIGSLWFDADAGCEKRVAFGDIAVLVRKNAGDAEHIAAELTRRGIPVSLSSRTNICDHFEARLLIDWFSYLDNPEQDIPLVTAMLSAIGGFDERELAHIRLSAKGEPYTFREACAAYERQNAGDPISLRLAAFRKRAEELRALSLVRNAAEMAVLLLAEGLEEQIAAQKDGAERLARVERLVREAESCNDIHTFLARLNSAGGRIELEGGGGEDAVRIVTMHASKGLEYPIVILAGLDEPFHGADRDELMWTERFGAAPRSYDVAQKTVYDTVLRRAAEKVQEAEELVGERNLLYVAMTRARYRLHMVFSGREHAISPEFAKRFSDFIDFTACAPFFAEREEEREPLRREPVPVRSDGRTVSLIRSLYRAPYPHEESVNIPLKSSATALMRGEEEHIEAGSGRGKTVEEGLAYHAFLEYAEFGKDAEEELSRMRGERLSEEQAALLDLEKLRAILRMPSLLAAIGKRVFREQKFLVRAPACDFFGGSARDEVVFQGAIDLLIEDEDGYTILDYKFSSRSDADIRAHYAVQIALYRRAVAETFGIDEKTVRARILNIALCREIEM